jgi:putative SOS response-associated peptidase YedK
MCGKFTSRAPWTEIVDFIHATPPVEQDGNDRSIAFRVMSDVPMILWDHVNQRRRVVPMRWGFPDPRDGRKPRPVHGRAETIETTNAFAAAFRDGQRGIVLVNSFNEAPDSGAQHTITPAGPIGIAFVWRRFDGAGLPAPMFACVMVTVPANALIAALPTDRMPAVLAPEDWAVWLGEQPASLADVKGCLRTVEDVRWTMREEERAAKTRRAKPTISDPGGLF